MIHHFSSSAPKAWRMRQYPGPGGRGTKHYPSLPTCQTCSFVDHLWRRRRGDADVRRCGVAREGRSWHTHEHRRRQRLRSRIRSSESIPSHHVLARSLAGDWPLGDKTWRISKSRNIANTDAVICLELLNRCQLGIVYKPVYGRKDDQYPLSPTTPSPNAVTCSPS